MMGAEGIEPSTSVLGKYFVYFLYVYFPYILVGEERIEPSTSVLSGQRSATELRAHQNICAGQRSTTEPVALTFCEF